MGSSFAHDLVIKIMIWIHCRAKYVCFSKSSFINTTCSLHFFFFYSVILWYYYYSWLCMLYSNARGDRSTIREMEIVKRTKGKNKSQSTSRKTQRITNCCTCKRTIQVKHLSETKMDTQTNNCMCVSIPVSFSYCLFHVLIWRHH